MEPLSEENWRAWSPEVLASHLKQTNLPWYVVGGWALDLWHEHQTRVHEDLEFAVLKEHLQEFRYALPQLEFFSAKDGTLAHIPRNEPLPNNVFQFWAADQDSQSWRVYMMAEGGSKETWVYKRDKRLKIPRKQAVRLSTNSQIPYLAPQLVLLFKAKHHRAKDDFDFIRALPKLDDKERKQLRTLLIQTHPNHAWIDRL